MEPINSKPYWDARFATDWEQAQGPGQSRFFSRVAMAHLPSWLFRAIREQRLSVVDWGCAQGDGTDELAALIDASQLSGVDFSRTAVEQAGARYPAIRFIQANWLEAPPTEAPPETWDIVFSSNTLEHFHQPFDVLQVLCARARKALVLVLPYRERDRIAEHHFSFLPDNLPARLPNGFRLLWARVINCRGMAESYWPGEQIVLVYGSPADLSTGPLMLSDCEISKDDTGTQIQALGRDLDRLNQLVKDQQTQLKDQQTQVQVLVQAVAERDEKIAALDRQSQTQQRVLGQQNQQLRAELMTLSNWAAGIQAHPLRYGLKRAARDAARVTLHALPLPAAAKQRLRTSYHDLVRRLRPRIGPTAVATPALAPIYPRGDDAERDVFVFAVIDWHFRMQRPQQLARSLARKNRRVLYFSNHFVDAAEPGYALEQLADADGPIYQIKLHLRGAPAIYFGAPSEGDLAMLRQSMAKVLLDFAASSSVSIVQHAYWYPLVRQLPNSYRVYDCMDHHEGFGDVADGLIRLEKEMLAQVDLVTVTSTWLADFAHAFNRNVAVVRNAVDYDYFSIQPKDIYRDPGGRKIIGYYGAIAEWFDVELVRTLAQRQPECLILLVGNDTINAAKALSDLPNVKFTGEVPYASLTSYLYAFDVCLLPFRRCDLTLATNPVKVYEYLAAGKQVVCVDLPEVAQFGDLVVRAASTDDFVQQVGRILNEGDAAAHGVEQRRHFASEQTWHHRSAELLAAVAGIRLPRVSVVVLTFNNLDLTKACLRSILARSDYPELEIIVVDNASSDDTPAYLGQLAQEHANIRLILNDKNLGFAAGNNIGMAAATGDYIVVLNNDTVVTTGWVLTLLRHFQEVPDLGLLGPVTANIGNEAKIDISYADLSAMPDASRAYTASHMGELFHMQNAAFFCVMMRRQTFESVGSLDESFGIGFFEDDDYCRRVEQAGLKIFCAEDVFVHHHLSASFDKIKQQDRQELFKKNKLIYEKKWGPWMPHRYRNH